MAESINPELDGPRKLFSSLKDVHPKISVLWVGGLILMMMFFWRTVGPGSSILCFCCMPVFFMIIVAVLAIGNIINTVRNGIKLVLLWRKYEPLQLNQRYVMISVLINVVGWVAVVFIPIHWTWEGWYLDKHWGDYNAAIQEPYLENLEVLDSELGKDELKLPKQDQNLSFDSIVHGTYGQVYFGFHQGQDGRYGILYCQEAYDCEMKAAIYVDNDTPACWSLRPHWYRCIVTNW